MRQMTSCQTAANEFLRQYWSSVYPPSSDVQTAAVMTPAQRSAKGLKMIGYLSRTQEKVDALIKTAQKEGVDHERVREASKTTKLYSHAHKLYRA
jgi:transcription initiation factor TFIIH subunit 1